MAAQAGAGQATAQVERDVAGQRGSAAAATDSTGAKCQARKVS